MGQINPLEYASGAQAPAPIGVSVKAPRQLPKTSSKWVKDPETGRIYNAEAIVPAGQQGGQSKSAKF